MSKPSINGTESRYRGDSGRQYHEGHRQVPREAYPWVARVRAAKLQPYLSADDTVLEYGVGYGWNLWALTCKRRIGYDVAEALAPTLMERGIEFVPDLHRLGAQAVDMVLCHHTLEHLKNPALALEELRPLLRPNGRLLVFTPWERELRHACFARGDPSHHLYTWNVQNLGNLAEDCGYRVEASGVGSYGYDRFAAVWALRMRIGESGYRLLRGCMQALRPLREVHVLARPAKPGPASA
jgi:SAM-dependent methyltransferase